MKRVLTKQATSYIGKMIMLEGWVDRIRSHGKIIFVDLRDRWGKIQIVFDLEKSKQAYQLAKTLKKEWVVKVEGIVNKRPENLVNHSLATGTIELEAKKMVVLSEAKTLPFSVDTDGYEISEEKRLKYRYLDIRRRRLLRNLIMREDAFQFIRKFLNRKEFIEVETPLLAKSTPEGARDFLVPSRLYPGEFYALPQSPQQFKQLLMVGGIERYFQIAKCLRDEDPRSDRQAEFTQLDLEMSFPTQDYILQLIEELFVSLVKEIFPNKTIQQVPFPRLDYKDVMNKYKTDRPDLRQNKNDKNTLAFAFIINFPMFDWSKEDKRWKAQHHPFTAPQTDSIEEIKKHPESILANQYDFVLNGEEIGGGSLRTTNLNILEAVFEVLGHKKEEIHRQFSDYFEAFQYGVPPHGGIAVGLDRFLAMALGEPSIREVIAFPKTGDGLDLMMGAPSPVSDKQLRELHLKILKDEKKGEIRKN